MKFLFLPFLVLDGSVASIYNGTNEQTLVELGGHLPFHDIVRGLSCLEGRPGDDR